MSIKQNVLLARTEHTKAQYNELLKGYIDAFKKGQSLFQGGRMTYRANEGYLDEPSKKGNKLVQNTVPEYLDYFVKTCGDHITNLFNIEATNASGKAKAPLIVDGKNWGEYSTLELLRLKSFLDEQQLVAMYNSLPVRSDTQTWKEATDEEYKGKPVYQTEIFEAQNRTTLKESYILKDPNVDPSKNEGRHQPQVVTKDTPVVMGQQTTQYFSGEISHREKAEILSRLTILKTAVKEALVKANEAIVIASDLSAQKIFNFLHKGRV